MRCNGGLVAAKTPSPVAPRRKPSPRAGQVIVFDEPLSFSDGTKLPRWRSVADPEVAEGTARFRAPGSSSLYRIPNIKSRSTGLVDPPG